MTWQPEIDEIERRRQRALEIGGEERVARQRETRPRIIRALRISLGPKTRHGIMS